MDSYNKDEEDEEEDAFHWTTLCFSEATDYLSFGKSILGRSAFVFAYYVYCILLICFTKEHTNILMWTRIEHVRLSTILEEHR